MSKRLNPPLSLVVVCSLLVLACGLIPGEVPTISVTSGPGLGRTMISPQDGITMIFVPTGEFYMGGYGYDTYLVHTVYLDSFWIDKTEITNQMFVKFLNNIVSEISFESGELVRYQDKLIYDLDNYACPACKVWPERIIWDGSKFLVVSGFENHPVSQVSWYGADLYCVWADRRLPTEAECVPASPCRQTPSLAGGLVRDARRRHGQSYDRE